MVRLVVCGMLGLVREVDIEHAMVGYEVDFDLW